jgi:hypothetical protein
MVAGCRVNQLIENSVRDMVRCGPSIFGQLMEVSRLRHEDKRYYHPLSSQHGVAEVDAILRRVHREIFREWLLLSLRQQEEDLTIFLRGLDDDRASADGLSALCPSLLPERHLLPERELFLSDMRVVIDLIYGEAPEAQADGAPASRLTAAGKPRRRFRFTKWLLFAQGLLILKNPPQLRGF